MTQLIAPRDDSDLRGYAAVAAQSFGLSAADALDWPETPIAKRGIIRVAVEGDRVVGGAIALPVNQLFGGRAVSAGAVGEVAVVPERRGRGVGAALLKSLDAPMREAGIAVSPLWPSTLWLYRRSGWEVAGRAETFSVSSRAIARMSGSGEPVSDPGTAARELQRHVAGNWNGPFERPDWWWDWRHPVPAPDRQYRYGWTEEGELTGFLAFRHLSRTDRAHGLLVTELWTRTGNALNGLLGFLGSHGAQVPEMTFGPAVLPMRHDLLWLACGADVQARGYAPWMLRLVDPRTALQARGWSAALDHRVELEIHDPMTERPQRLVLEVSGGEASITPGGSGEARLGLGALSAWYAGGLTAVRAARLGLASGPPEVLAAMDSLTRDRPAWLPEVF